MRSKIGLLCLLAILALSVTSINIVKASPPVLSLLDTVEIGNVTSEAGHGFGKGDRNQGWSPVIYPDGASGGEGSYGGATKPLRVVWEMSNPPDEGKRDAYLTMNAYQGKPSKLCINALDGMADDSFKVYVGDGITETLVYQYTGHLGGTEDWICHEIALPSISGSKVIVRIKATGPAWDLFWKYGQLAVRSVELWGRFWSSKLSRTDYVKIGDPTSEAGHVLIDWSEVVQPGTLNLEPGYWGYGSDVSYFGYDGGQTVPALRTVWGRPIDYTRTAYLILHGDDYRGNMVVLMALDGVADDSFDVYLGSTTNVLVYHYTAREDIVGWVIHKIDISSYRLTGAVDITIKATGQAWSGWSTFGQLAINWVELWGTSANIKYFGY